MENIILQMKRNESAENYHFLGSKLRCIAQCSIYFSFYKFKKSFETRHMISIKQYCILLLEYATTLKMKNKVETDLIQ